MRVLISGASGLIGSELSLQLGVAGHDVRRLVRREATRPGEFRWDPAALSLDPAALDGVDAVVNLSGASLARLPSVSYTHLRAHETDSYLVCRLLLEKK